MKVFLTVRALNRLERNVKNYGNISNDAIEEAVNWYGTKRY